MYKRIMAVVGKDFLSGRRDNMISYVVLAPLALAVLMRLFLPSLENLEMRFAVSRDVEAGLVAHLEEYGRVEVLPDRREVVERVLALDDVAGIVPGPGGYEVILEGNELEAVRELPGAIIDYFVHGRPLVGLEVESLGLEHNPARHYTAALVLFSVVIIGGLAAGLTMVEDKEGRTIKAYGISPLSLKEYLAAKGLLAVSFIFTLSFLAALIMRGREMDYGALFWMVLASLPAGLVLAFVIGAFARDQMTAIALMKGLFIFFIGIPLGSLFMGQQWHVFFYPFLNYWAMQALLAAVSQGAGSETWVKGAWAMLTGLGPLLLVLGLVRRRLDFNV